MTTLAALRLKESWLEVGPLYQISYKISAIHECLILLHENHWLITADTHLCFNRKDILPNDSKKSNVYI